MSVRNVPAEADRAPAAGIGAGMVLLVEDDHSIGALVRTYLDRLGYRVVWVRSGEDALIELSRHPVKIVVLDIRLPGMDGFDVCRAIRARSAVPIVMLTARDEEADRVTGLELGADDYIPKPFSPRELAARRPEGRKVRPVLEVEESLAHESRGIARRRACEFLTKKADEVSCEEGKLGVACVTTAMRLTEPPSQR